MATRYWQGTGATAIDASDAANWGTTTTGGTAAIPANTDIIVFGHSETIAAGKGMAPCNFNIASLSLAEIVVLEGYRYTVSTTVGRVGTVFNATTDVLTSVDSDFINDGFKPGMVVDVMGSKDNNGTYTIAASGVTKTTLDLTTGLATETIASGAEYEISIVAAPSYLQIAEGITTNGLYLNGTITPDGSTRTISFAGSYLGTNPVPSVEYLQRYILNGDNASILSPERLRYSIDQTANSSTPCHFDDGPYPVIASGNASKFSPQYIPPIGNSGSADFYSLLLTGSDTVQFQPLNTVNNAAGDASKVFKITSFDAPNLQFTGAVFDTGLSTFHITANDRFLPTTGNITDFGGTNTSFFAKTNNLVIEPGSTGAKYAGVRGRTTLTCANLTVKANATLRGTGIDGDNSSMITCLGHPQVEGTWNFYQLAPGIFSSNPWRTMPAVANGGTGLSDIPAGYIPYGETNLKMAVDATLKFDDSNDVLYPGKGLIIPEQGSTPIACPAGYGVVYVSSTNPTTLIFVSDTGAETTLGAGGGGSMSSFTLAGSSGSSQSITDGNTLTIAQGAGITSVASATDTVTITNTGVTSNVAGTGITVSGATGAVTIGCDLEGTELKSTGETGGSKFLREDGDGSCSWQTVSGGGGSGTVTNIATTAPITGGAITSTGTIALDISGLTANTAIADADLLLIDDGANGTNRKTTFTEVKEWIRGDSVALGVTGGVNQLKIKDARADGELNPDQWGDGQVSWDFTDDIVGSSNGWDAVMTMKGWGTSYRVSQLFSSAASEGSGGKDTEPLYFRSGEDTGWGALRQVLTFPGTTPNADGSAGQVLQTDGSGALSWADIHGAQVAIPTGGAFSDTPPLVDALGNNLAVHGWVTITVGSTLLYLPAYKIR